MGRDEPVRIGRKLAAIVATDVAGHATKLDELLREIHQAPAVVRPPLGENPFRGKVIAPPPSAWSHDDVGAEYDLADQRDAITQPIKVGVTVPYGGIDLNSRKQVVPGGIGEKIGRCEIWVRAEDIDRKARIDRLSLIVDRTDR